MDEWTNEQRNFISTVLFDKLLERNYKKRSLRVPYPIHPVDIAFHLRSIDAVTELIFESKGRKQKGIEAKTTVWSTNTVTLSLN